MEQTPLITAKHRKVKKASKEDDDGGKWRIGRSVSVERLFGIF